MELKKREWVYVQNPNDYEIAACKCGNSNTQWSEYEGHIWCDHCNIDFIPEHDGVFSGPIPVKVCKAIGICFDKIYLNTNKFMKFEENFGIYVEPTTMKKIVESKIIEGNIHNEEKDCFEEISIDYEDFKFKIIGEKKDNKEIYIYVGIPDSNIFKLNTDSNGDFIKNENYDYFKKKMSKDILDEILFKRKGKQNTKI